VRSVAGLESGDCTAWVWYVFAVETLQACAERNVLRGHCDVGRPGTFLPILQALMWV